jgi:hypothetical protein
MKLKGLSRGMEIQICVICRMDEELWEILECEGAKEWREMVLEKRILNLNPIIGIQELA